MSIDPKLFVSKFPVIVGTLGLLIVGKTLLVTGVGRYFGLSTVAAARAGVLLAPGGEFAFVAFGDAVNQVRIFFSFLFIISYRSCSIS
jgi:Kef-type K+ transport system membrane component KefB